MCEDFLKTVKTIIFLRCPVPWRRNSLSKEERLQSSFVAFHGLACIAQWPLHLYDIWYVASVSPHKRVSLPCIFRQGKVFLAMRYPDHVTQFATFGVGHVLGLIGHCSRTISCKIRGPPGPKHCQLQTSDLELIFRWRINQTLSDPNWRLYTGFCVNSVWSGG